MNAKCTRCPLADEARHCPGQYNPRACALPPDRLRQSKGPGLLEQAASFAGAVVGHLAAGAPKASLEQQEARWAACRSCENLAGDSCRLCGCGLGLKISWADQSCPLDPPRWGPVEGSGGP